MLGMKVRDRITGFAGIVVGRVEYVTGCNQVLVAPPVGADGKHNDSHWFDEQRVEVTNPAERPIVLDNSRTPGPDRPAPIR